MTDRLWLARHGSTEWTGVRWCGRTDIPLSTGGLQEVVALADRLERVLPEHAIVLSSPARRATQTADQISRTRWGAADHDPTVVGELIEVDFGVVDGLTWVELEGRLPDVARAILGGDHIDWPGGESSDAVDIRVRAVRRRIEESPAPLVLVSHAAILGRIAGDLTGTAPHEWGLAPASALELTRNHRAWSVPRTSE